MMTSKEKKYDEIYQVGLTFSLSNFFDAQFTKDGYTGHSSFLIKSCVGFRVLFPNSIVHNHARTATGLDELDRGLPVLCKILASTYNLNTELETGIHRLRISGNNDDSNFGHYDAIHQEWSSEFLRYDHFKWNLLDQQKYVESMAQRQVELKRKKITLKSFWMAGNITLPLDFADRLVNLAANYPPDAIQFSCKTKKINFSENYTEKIEGETYDLKSNFIGLEEDSFRAEVKGGAENQPLSRDEYLKRTKRYHFSLEKMSESLSRQIQDNSNYNKELGTEVEKRIGGLEKRLEALSMSLGFLIFLSVVLIVILLLTLNSS